MLIPTISCNKGPPSVSQIRVYLYRSTHGRLSRVRGGASKHQPGSFTGTSASLCNYLPMSVPTSQPNSHSPAMALHATAMAVS